MSVQPIERGGLVEEDLAWEGDYFVNTKTGEILAVRGEGVGFHVVDDESAEWVLEKLFDIDSEITAEQQKLERAIAALKANSERITKAFEHRRTWLLRRFEEELRTWAAGEIEGSKKRHVQTMYGRLAFRKTQARVAVEDEDRAVEWAEQYRPDAVAIEKRVRVSMLPKDLLALDDETLTDLGFRRVPEGETFTISTGLEAS